MFRRGCRQKHLGTITAEDELRHLERIAAVRPDNKRGSRGGMVVGLMCSEWRAQNGATKDSDPDSGSV